MSLGRPPRPQPGAPAPERRQTPATEEEPQAEGALHRLLRLIPPRQHKSKEFIKTEKSRHAPYDSSRYNFCFTSGKLKTICTAQFKKCGFFCRYTLISLLHFSSLVESILVLPCYSNLEATFVLKMLFAYHYKNSLNYYLNFLKKLPYLILPIYTVETHQATFSIRNI